MNAKLMIHCGGQEVARERLAGTETPPPTATWHPIPHDVLLREVEQSLERNRLCVTAERHALAREGDRYFGLLQVANGSNPTDHSWVLGLRNSHDQSFPAGLVVGSRVFVCDNLAFSGEIVIARRHTRWILRDLPRLVLDGVAQLAQRWHSQEERFARYRETPVTDGEAHDLVIRALDARALTTLQVPEVVREWRRTRHPEFWERTAWSLFNAFTSVVGTGSVWLVARRTQALHGVFDAHCGLTARDLCGPEAGPEPLAEAA
jgi:hypothetical protein